MRKRQAIHAQLHFCTDLVLAICYDGSIDACGFSNPFEGELKMTDLNSMSRNELIKLRADVDKAIATVAERERRAALEAAERVAAEHGFSLSELTGVVSGKAARGMKPKSPAKYRNPANSDDTWSGRGRKPRWILEVEAAGRPLSDFAI
jgi:DNA-binding protein H-NS